MGLWEVEVMERGREKRGKVGRHLWFGSTFSKEPPGTSSTADPTCAPPALLRCLLAEYFPGKQMLFS